MEPDQHCFEHSSVRQLDFDLFILAANICYMSYGGGQATALSLPAVSLHGDREER